MHERLCINPVDGELHPESWYHHQNIDLRCVIEAYIVEISRDTTYPSGKEWETIFKHWPYFTPVPNADQCQGTDRRMALRGTVNKRQQIKLM